MVNVVFSQRFAPFPVFVLDAVAGRGAAMCAASRNGSRVLSQGPVRSTSNKNIRRVFGFRVNTIYLWQLPLCSFVAAVFFLSLFCRVNVSQLLNGEQVEYTLPQQLPSI